MTNASNRGTDRPSTSPTGTPRVGRRDSQRRRVTHTPTFFERFRTPIVAIAVVALLGVVGFAVIGSASASSYACTTMDTVAAGTDGSQIQSDLGSTHIGVNDKITYPTCPPASGKHVNRSGFGPLEPRVYGPDDRSEPQGWIHNLEHGGLVLLYSCEKVACDETLLQQLRSFSTGFPASAICQIPSGFAGPIVARFEQMPTKFAALLWGRALYLDTLDAQKIYDFFLQYGELVSDDGTWLAPPEEQCAAPSPSISASPSPSISASPSASPSGTASPSPSPSAS